ncbi:tyrosine-type recombinase/integrase [uncultured Dysosmobacter sp.]|uniref:tyrosine-type recombinase/integrase n=1 Tax=uncultured Dysosmobacter sp. TaxID=2591384 RepID=UPI00260E875C|nr:tyrosine-type recombinase/integrase [uncultured Dysosmobacter sp.]
MARKRKSGQGTVRLRKDGRWEGRIVVGYDDRGYPKTKNVTAKTKAECEQKLKALIQSRTPQNKTRITPDMPFGEWLDHWYQTYSKPHIRLSTQAAYETDVYLHVIPEIGHIPLDKLTQNDLQQFYARLKKGGNLKDKAGVSNGVVRACHGKCRSALEKAKAEGLIKKNPAIGCKLPPKKAREMQVLTREEMQRFLIQAKEEGYYEAFLLELATGMRRGELMALQWNDFNMATGELHICRQVCRVKGKLSISKPKTKGSVRSVILPPAVVQALKEYKKTVHSRWLFPSPVKEDMPIDPANIRQRLHIVLEHAQCKQVRFHDLRHTFATNALANGMDVKTLSTIIGHVSSATTLNIYAHTTEEMQRQAAANIDRGIGKAEAQEAAVQPTAKTMATFQAYKGKKRKSGTGYLKEIKPGLWEGRYSPVWPDGKKHSRDVYGKTKEECETKLAELITQMKKEIAAVKAKRQPIPDGISKKERAVMDYMKAHPEVTNKSQIAKGAGVNRSTVQRHYDKIREIIIEY